MLCKRRIVAEGLDVNVPATEITCDPNSIFRTINGTCNNLRNPSFGAINTQFNRLIPADYGDTTM